MDKKIYLVTFCLGNQHIAYEIVSTSSNKARCIATSTFNRNYGYVEDSYISTIELKEPVKFHYIDGGII